MDSPIFSRAMGLTYWLKDNAEDQLQAWHETQEIGAAGHTDALHADIDAERFGAKSVRVDFGSICTVSGSSSCHGDRGRRGTRRLTHIGNRGETGHICHLEEEEERYDGGTDSLTACLRKTGLEVSSRLVPSR